MSCVVHALDFFWFIENFDMVVIYNYQVLNVAGEWRNQTKEPYLLIMNVCFMLLCNQQVTGARPAANVTWHNNTVPLDPTDERDKTSISTTTVSTIFY